MPACFWAWAGGPAASTRENTSAAEMGRMVVTLSEESLPEDYAACAKSAWWPLLQRDDVPCRTRPECGFDDLEPGDDFGDEHRWRRIVENRACHLAVEWRVVAHVRAHALLRLAGSERAPGVLGLLAVTGVAGAGAGPDPSLPPIHTGPEIPSLRA